MEKLVTMVQLAGLHFVLPSSASALTALAVAALAIAQALMLLHATLTIYAHLVESSILPIKINPLLTLHQVTHAIPAVQSHARLLAGPEQIAIPVR